VSTVPGRAEPLLQIRDLEVTFRTRAGRVRAVRGIDLDAAHGEVLGLVGESGSGKSVSMLAVMGLLPPGARVTGSIKLGGRELLGLSRQELRQLRGSRVAMIFQDPMTSLNPVLPVGFQVAEAVRVHSHRVSRRELRRRVVELLQLVSIPRAADRLESYPFEFSGGMRQRVMIAMAIANDPDLLIADEPTTALDVTIQAQILEVLAELQRESELGLILITHDLGVVAGLVQRVAVMYAGKVVERGGVDDVFYAPSHPYTQGLLACLPRLYEPNREIERIPGSPPSMLRVPRACAFHPRCVHAQDVCRVEEPALRRVNATEAACHFAERVGAARGENAARVTALEGTPTT
jgi:peptide/nickel transport system ATP-binding protein